MNVTAKTAFRITPLLWLCAAISASAHQDIILTRNYGNVKVRAQTGYREYEEPQKAFMAGRLASVLVRDHLHTPLPVFLDFRHAYTRRAEPPAYFVAVNRGDLDGDLYSQTETFLQQEGIVIRQVTGSIDLLTTLKLLEFAIRNVDMIRRTQAHRAFEPRQWSVPTVDPELLAKAVAAPPSGVVRKVAETRVWRDAPKDAEEWEINCAADGGKFSIYYQSKSLVTLDDVYVFYRRNYYEAVVFDTPTSFYYVRGEGPKACKRHTISDTKGGYEPFIVEPVTGTGFFISFRYWDKQRGRELLHTMLYVPREDVLIEDFSSARDAMVRQAKTVAPGDGPGVRNLQSEPGEMAPDE